MGKVRISGEPEAASLPITAPINNPEQTSARRRIICVVLFLVTLALYLPALRHEFLNYDDQQYVTDNLHVRAGLTWQGLIWAFGTRAGNWHPLTWLSHMLDCQLYGLRPWGHHLTSVLLHAAGSVLLFLMLSRLTRTVWRSAAVAALFAWHPLHVESVAWVSERKDVLSAVFFFLTLLAYEKYVSSAKCHVSGAQPQASKLEGGAVSGLWSVVSGQQSVACRAVAKRRRVSGQPLAWYCAALVFFALGLMSKGMLVTVPFVLLLLDFWPLNRTSRRQSVKASERETSQSIHAPTLSRSDALTLLLEKVPFFLLTPPCIWLTLVAQQSAMVSERGLSVAQRLEHTLLAYVHYLGALFVPVHMAVYYPYEKQVPWWEVGLAGMVVLGVTLVASLLFRSASPGNSHDAGVVRPGQWSAPKAFGGGQWSPFVTGWFWFLGMLVPVIGLVQVGDQAWADRYTYLPSIGIFMAVVWGLAEFILLRQGYGGQEVQGSMAIPRRSLTVAALFVAAALLVGVVLLWATSIQLSYWKNSRILFEHAAKVTKNNPLAATLLGSLLDKEGKLEEAKAKYHEALGYSPRFPLAHVCLGHVLDQQGKLDEAIAEYKKGLFYKPTQKETLILLATTLAKNNQVDTAAAYYKAALKLDPESALAHNNLAKLLHKEGKLDEAIGHYEEAIKWDPQFAQAHNNLGILLLQRGHPAEGTTQLRQALRLKPGEQETELNLAQALTQQEQWSEAAALFSKTVTGATADPNIHYQFGTALEHLQKKREAMGQYASALLLRQDFPDALDALSWILATSPNPAYRNGSEALKMSQRACDLTGGKDPAKLRTLAAAYAEVGRFGDAEATARKALDLQSATEKKAVLGRMIEQFKSSKPWREAQ